MQATQTKADVETGGDLLEQDGQIDTAQGTGQETVTSEEGIEGEQFAGILAVHRREVRLNKEEYGVIDKNTPESFNVAHTLDRNQSPGVLRYIADNERPFSRMDIRDEGLLKQLEELKEEGINVLGVHAVDFNKGAFELIFSAEDDDRFYRCTFNIARYPTSADNGFEVPRAVLTEALEQILPNLNEKFADLPKDRTEAVLHGWRLANAGGVKISIPEENIFDVSTKEGYAAFGNMLEPFGLTQAQRKNLENYQQVARYGNFRHIPYVNDQNTVLSPGSGFGIHGEKAEQLRDVAKDKYDLEVIGVRPVKDFRTGDFVLYYRDNEDPKNPHIVAQPFTIENYSTRNEAEAGRLLAKVTEALIRNNLELIEEEKAPKPKPAPVKRGAVAVKTNPMFSLRA